MGGRRLVALRSLVASAVLLIAGAIFTTSVSAADGACDASVANQTELNAAITCFNAETTAGNHVITVTQGFVYTTTVVTIDNETAGVSLEIDGMGNTIDAAGNGNVLIVLGDDTTVSVTDVTLTGGNASPGGGGIRNQGTLTVTDTTIEGNTGANFGGGIFSNGPSMIIINSTISGNSVASASGNGGGIYNTGDIASISHTTITDNTASTGGGVSSLGFSVAKTEVAGSIIAVFDTRAGQGAADDFEGLRKHGVIHTTSYQVAGDDIDADQGGVVDTGGGEGTCGVPDGASAVLINLEGVNAVREGNFWVSAAGTTTTGGVLNFNNVVPKMNNANAVVVPLDANGELALEVNAGNFTTVGTDVAHARGVILGYFN